MKKIFPLLLSAVFGLTLFFFSPVDVFLANQSDLIVNTARIAVPMGITAAAVTLLTFAVLCILKRLSSKVYAAVSCIILGAVGAAYFQMTFFNGHMVVLDGRETDYSRFDLYNTADFVLYFVILVLPVILWASREQYKESKILKVLDSAKAAYLCAIVIFMQTAGTVSLAVTNGVHNNPADIKLPLLSYEPAMKVSSEKNIAVFLTDMMDGFWTDELLERYPEMYERLDGFTYYHDNISEQCFTFPSVAQLLTRCEYEEEGEYEYFERAWSSESVPKVLHDNGWRVYLMPDMGTTYSDMSQIMPFSDNVSEYSYSVNYTGDGGIVPIMINFSLFKCLPYRYKPFFGMSYSDAANGFFIFDDEENEKSVLPYKLGIGADLKYYSYISENKLTADSPSPSFTFVHLHGAHDESEQVSALNSGYDGNCDTISTARGCFEIIFRYMSELERLGAYDNTVIIILADHGRVPEYIDSRAISAPDTAALFVKPAGARGTLLTNDEAQLSNRNFAASVLEYAGLDHSVFGSSYNDIIEGGGKQERIFNATNYYNFGSKFVDRFDRFTERIIYRVSGNSRDFANWELISTG